MGASLIKPWIGVLAYYMLALFVPAAMWPWVFKDTRVSFYIALATILGFILFTFGKKIDFTVLKSKQNLYLFILWFFLVISYFFSPYGATENSGIMFDPKYLLTNMTKVILFYYIAILLIDNKQKYHFLIMIILATATYFIYWGNMQYFTGELTRLGTLGLTGPGFAGISSVYTDENAFAMFFVMSIPFLYFMGDYYNNKIIKYFLWFLIPWAWHAIFLTGSRGGLIGLGIVTLFIAIRSKKKILMIVIPILLILAFVFQAGGYMQKKSTMILNIEGEGSAQSRLHAWDAALKMTIDHPITGVGLGNFMSAFRDYSDKEGKIIVTHNSVLQFASEAGIFAGLMFLLLCFGLFTDYWKHLKLKSKDTDPFFVATRESIMGSLAGFFVCAQFLNLATYETFYYLLVLNTVQNRLVNSKEVTDKDLGV